MSAFDLVTGEADARLRDMMRQPEPGPGAFANFWGAAGNALMAAPLEVGRALSPALDAYGKAAAFRDAPMATVLGGQPVPDLDKLKRETVDRIGENDLRHQITPELNRLTPDPRVTGTASQLVFGFGKTASKAVGYSMLGGPLPGAAMFGLDEGANETMRLEDKGVDTGTAIKAGAVHGVASAVSAALPVAGKTKLQTAGIVVAGGPAAYVAEQASIREIVRAAQYDRIAEDYKPFDPMGLIVSTAAPAAFGVGAHALRSLKGEPRGIRNNNPGNLVKSDIPWDGKVAGAESRFEVFSTPEQGIAAMARNLISYQDRHGLDTVQDIIGRWSPPDENKTGVYVATVARELAVKATDRLNLNDEGTLTRLTQAIVRHENGKQPYSGAQIAAGVKAAIEGRAIRPTVEQIDAARVANLAAHADGSSLSAAGDITAANAHIRAMDEAARLMDRGDPVRVADLVRIEKTKLDEAYSRVLGDHRGPADDPLVMIRPDDIEAVAMARGGWKGLGDVEVKGQGFGLVKFLWRHGEASNKLPESQVTRGDITAFPEVVRNFDPTPIPRKDGSSYREWRVELPDAAGRMRQIVFVDKPMDGDQPRHVVSTYVQEPKRPGSRAQLSKRKTDWSPESPGKWSDTRAGDTQPGVLHRAGQDQPVDPSIAAAQQATKDGLRRSAEVADTPEQRAAYQALADDPGKLLPTGELDASGRPILRTAADLLAEADAHQIVADEETRGISAAITCFLRG
ncbi:hypothetical protein [Sulfuritalea hydrogenivorans]|uniref:Uncharacterized protein n=1 Tax=Sulfuritalea hydrogenivorans sk43H TaxID=1223802 RepID=W0SHL5_9PROT|nr:hypothetical protein [Sulfuritalea hydrogenivorans]BAO29383.1 hypothetical protein SUTH_01590 [Sulfuritalea hydrogenivorans sk43H]